MATTASPSGATGTSAHTLIGSDRVEGTSVYAQDGTHVGSIDRLMIDKASGRVVYATVTFGGFLGMGEDRFTLPWAKLGYDTTLGGYRTDLTADQVKGAPTLENSHEPFDRAREGELHSYYGVSPYWGL